MLRNFTADSESDRESLSEISRQTIAGTEKIDVHAYLAEEVVTRKEKELKDIADTNERYDSLLATIDEQLRNPKLSEDEIDALLDKRAEILARRNG